MDSDPPDQAYPSSIMQDGLQPSDGSVFPSSHSSSGCLNPSPHITSQVFFSTFGDVPPSHCVQVLDDEIDPPVQIKLSSIAHDALQPSPESVFPSSHVSSPSYTLESPHLTSQTLLSLLGDEPSREQS